MQDEHKKYEVILLDFDNTLVDLEKYWDNYIREFASKHQIKISNFSDFKYKIINNPEENFDAALVKEFRTENRKRQPVEIEFFPGVADTLNELKTHGYILGIVTNAGRGRINAILTAKGLQDFFAVIVCAEDVLNVKPAPEPVMKALEAVNKSPKVALLVGDSYAEVWAGRNAGVDTALLVNRNQEIPMMNGKPPTDRPTYNIEHFKDLLGIVERK